VPSALSHLAARLAPSDPDRIDWWRSAPFLALHLSPLALPWLGFGAAEATAAAATYLLGMFFVTAGYHRYFAHRAFRTGRAFQLLLAVGAQCTVQHGVLWWAGHHREHHRTSDGPGDVHSPARGLLWSHMGWFLSNRHAAVRLDRVRDLARFPELVWLERWYWVPPVAVGVAVAALGGARLLVGGYLLGLILLWHATFAINSLAHLWGTRPYPTGDDSRNNALLALLTFGEGWHNNHHRHPSSARQGFRWWQLDLTWLALRLLERVGVVRDLRPGPEGRRAGRPAARPVPRAAARPAATAAALPVLLLPRPAHGEAVAVEQLTGTARGADGTNPCAGAREEDHRASL
jgi:stearoyl-CoA desaturase (delta-9 desaturase)